MIRFNVLNKCDPGFGILKFALFALVVEIRPIFDFADIVLRVVFVGTFFGTSYYLLSVNNNCVKSHKNLREYLCEKV